MGRLTADELAQLKALQDKQAAPDVDVDVEDVIVEFEGKRTTLTGRQAARWLDRLFGAADQADQADEDQDQADEDQDQADEDQGKPDERPRSTSRYFR